MYTADSLATICAGAALLADRWVEWVCIRRFLMAELPDPSFREACLLALRHPSVGLSTVADCIQREECQEEKRKGDGINAFVGTLIVRIGLTATLQ